MLEQYKSIKIGEDCLEPGLVLERIRLKARQIEGLPPENDGTLLDEALDNVYRPDKLRGKK